MAAHIRPVSENGSYDARNGLVLCTLHHSAFDAGLFEIDPASLELTPRINGPSLDRLMVTRKSIAHLRRLPHPSALIWRWETSHRKQGG